MAAITKFAKGTNGGTKRCAQCGDRTWASRLQDGWCFSCRYYRDQHAAGAHPTQAAGCRDCLREARLAREAVL